MVSEPIDRRRLVALYEQRLAADTSSRVFLPLAELYRGDARPEDARRILEEGLARHPDFVSALVALAQVLLDLGEESRALEILTRVLTRDPQNMVALRLLAAAAENGDDWPGAVLHLERVVRLEPGDFEAVARLQAARNRLAGGEMPQPTAPAAPAPVAAATVATVVPTDALGGVVTLTLADLYMRQGYTDRALDLLAKMAAAEPDRADVQERLVRLAQADGSAGAPAGTFLRRRTAGERQGERQQFEAWLERSGED
jgi:predicted Zn-dependent protease